jgi:hypothetical protein
VKITIKKEFDFYNIYVDGVLIDWIYKVDDCGRNYYSWSKNLLPKRLNNVTCYFNLKDAKEEVLFWLNNQLQQLAA